MSMKAVIRKRIKYAIKQYRRNSLRKSEHKRILKTIKNYPVSIPELTDDEIKEIRDYWNKYGLSFPLDWHRFFYGTTGQKDCRYIPEPVFHLDIKPFFNNRDAGFVWGDKSYMDYFLKDCKTVRSVIRNVDGRLLDEQFNLIDPAYAQTIVNQFEKLVIKPSMNTDTGKGVQLLSGPYQFDDIQRQYKKNYVIQIPLKQHETMSKLNESSINTIRVNSVLFETEAHVMSAFVKVGQRGEFADNHGHERFFIGINMDGTFCDFAIDHDLNKYSAIPSGYEFAGQEVPSFRKICDAIEKAHKHLPHFGFAFWDVCVDEQGEPVIVEVNLRYPDTVIPQSCGNGGFLGEYTDKILRICLSQK